MPASCAITAGNCGRTKIKKNEKLPKDIQRENYEKITFIEFMFDRFAVQRWRGTGAGSVRHFAASQLAFTSI